MGVGEKMNLILYVNVLRYWLVLNKQNKTNNNVFFQFLFLFLVFAQLIVRLSSASPRKTKSKPPHPTPEIKTKKRKALKNKKRDRWPDVEQRSVFLFLLPVVSSEFVGKKKSDFISSIYFRCNPFSCFLSVFTLAPSKCSAFIIPRPATVAVGRRLFARLPPLFPSKIPRKILIARAIWRYLFIFALLVRCSRLNARHVNTVPHAAKRLNRTVDFIVELKSNEKKSGLYRRRSFSIPTWWRHYANQWRSDREFLVLFNTTGDSGEECFLACCGLIPLYRDIKREFIPDSGKFLLICIQSFSW